MVSVTPMLCRLSSESSYKIITMAVKFLDTFSDTQYPIVSHLCDYLLIGDIVALTRTCRSLSTLYRNLLPAQWNVNRDLRQFVHDPNGLRSAMAKNDAVIAGSFALQFFERSTWRAADLDLYVQQGHQFESLTRYFMDTEGYHPSARVESTDEYGTGAAIVTVLLSPIGDKVHPSNAILALGCQL